MDTSGTITVLYVNADESASTLTPEDEQFDVAVAANADEPVEQSSGGGVDCAVTSATHDDWTIDLGESEDWRARFEITGLEAGTVPS